MLKSRLATSFMEMLPPPSVSSSFQSALIFPPYLAVHMFQIRTSNCCASSVLTAWKCYQETQYKNCTSPAFSLKKSTVGDLEQLFKSENMLSCFTFEPFVSSFRPECFGKRGSLLLQTGTQAEITSENNFFNDKIPRQPHQIQTQHTQIKRQKR